MPHMVPLPFFRGRSTCYSDRLHGFSVNIPRCYKDIYVNTFFPCRVILWNSLPIKCFLWPMMIVALNGIIWIIMQHSRSWSTFTLDAFLTVSNLICKSAFNNQPFDGLSIINTLKLLAKKRIVSFDNTLTRKIKM